MTGTFLRSRSPGFFLPLCLFWVFLPYAQAEVEKRIRVRVAEQVPSAMIRGYDIRIHALSRGEQKASLLASSDKTSEWEVSCQGGRVKILPRFTHRTEGRFAFQKKVKQLDLPSSVGFRTPGGFITLGTTPYRDELRVHARGDFCDIVNHVDLEKYLDGLVNSEFSSKWNEESISAQVVAARTYAYYQILEARRKKAHFDLDATTRDQVYNGSLKEDFHSSKIVQKTRGWILTPASASVGASGDSGVAAAHEAQNSPAPLPIKAFYHSTCGGKTELPEHVWGGQYAGLHKSVPCPYCSSSPRYQWTLDLSRKEIQEGILRGVKQSSAPGDWPKYWRDAVTGGKLLDLRVGPKNAENRVTRVVSVWSSGRELLDLPIKGAQFREWMGPARFRSTAFDVYSNSRENVWHFSGLGNGHGVGMCQWGAKVMGEKGRKMDEILKLYYPDAVLHKLW